MDAMKRNLLTEDDLRRYIFIVSPMPQKLLHGPSSFWSISASELFGQLNSSPDGLTSDEAQLRLAIYGPNRLQRRKKTAGLALFLSQFKSPIILILIGAVILSFFLRDTTDAIIISVIILFSGFLGFKQEKGATDTVEKLQAKVQVQSMVLRDGAMAEISIEELVSGDVVIFRGGDIIPADCSLLEAKDLFVDEATLTGETYPVEKIPGLLPAAAPLAQLTSVLFMGTHVVSGSGKGLIARTGKETEFGKISDRLRLRPPETEFERGVKRFGYFLMEVTLILLLAIFAVNVYLARPVLDSFLFALALAVGLTPQLLPAIVSVNLAYGAKIMAEKKVIVKRLSSIENFGSMDVICSDKTGTLTEGKVRVHSALGTDREESDKVLFYAYLNACLETGFKNPIDEAIRTQRSFDLGGYKKLDEVPYDFLRKRLSILVSGEGRNFIVTKGALLNILSVCSSAEAADSQSVALSTVHDQILRLYEEFSSKGFRLLGVARCDVGLETGITKNHETDMTFLGFLVLYDPIKPGIIETIRSLDAQGVSLKIITGDNRLAAAEVSRQVGLKNPRIITGAELRLTSSEALLQQAKDLDVFAEVEPNQKERIISALKKSGHVVGYLGDGINDATALHAADVGISVDSAVDVAKEAADIVLLEHDLGVLCQGVRDGRRTFANTLKYIFMATSANFGNMFSMAAASSFLPFLPLLPKQILLTNLMTDFPEMTIAGDAVDKEMVVRPRRWNLSFIRNFMLVFGPLSSLFDFLTFGILLLLLRANPDQFRTGWFMESVVSASVIVLVVRTARPFYRSRPGRGLLITTLIIAGLALLVPALPIASLFGFKRVPAVFFLAIAVIVVLYISLAEVAKAIFYKKARF
jgi:Mg2+-importing ATPase